VLVISHLSGREKLRPLDRRGGIDLPPEQAGELALIPIVEEYGAPLVSTNLPVN
jgi:hypothetical protein